MMKSRVLTRYNYVERDFEIAKWTDKANYATFDTSSLFGTDQDGYPAYKVTFYWTNNGTETTTAFYVSYELLRKIHNWLEIYGKRLYRVS